MGLKKVMAKFKRRLVKVGNSRAVTLPAWFLGDTNNAVMVTIYQDHAEIVPISSI